MYSFTYHIPTRVLFGAGQLNHLHEEKMPGKKALIVTSNGKSMKANGYLGRVESELEQAGVAHVLFDQIKANPTLRNVTDGVQMVREKGCDFVVALGGGSTMDAGKAIALAAANSGNLWDYVGSYTGGKKTPENNALPVIAITTTAGTGSEVDFFSVITKEETDEKTGIGFPSMYPTLSVVDSDLMMTVPPKFTAWQGMDAFYHASESVINIKEHPMGEMFALKAIELLAKYLPIAYKNGDDKEARSNVALANSLAGYYMLCTSQHTMEHAMSSLYHDLPHGAGLIMISHEYFKFFADRKACEVPMMKMARAMGIDNPTSGQDFIKALDKLIFEVGQSGLKMSDFGVTEDAPEKFTQKCHEVLGGDTSADPLPLSDEDLRGIFERSYR